MRLIATLAVAACAVPAFAWDASGHELVMEIALKSCKPGTSAKVRALLGSATWTDVGGAKTKIHDYTLPAVGARFADDILNSQYGRNPYEKERYKSWHYIDLQIADYDQTLKNWPPPTTGKTVLQGIDDAVARIKGDSAVTSYPKGKTEALLFLAHFVGDIHQPLHCADNHDGGGHDPMRGPKERKIVPHKVWDEGPTHRYHLKAASAQQSRARQKKALQAIDAAAKDLLRTYGSKFSKAELADADPRDWAKESFKYAYANIYEAPQPLNQATLDNWQTASLKRATLAGLRLGRLLDRLAPSM